MNNSDPETSSLAAMVESTARRILAKHWGRAGIDGHDEKSERDGQIEKVLAAFKEAGLDRLGSEADSHDLPLCIAVCRVLGEASCTAPFAAGVLANMAMQGRSPVDDDRPTVFAISEDGVEIGPNGATGSIGFLDHASHAEMLMLLIPGTGIVRIDLCHSGAKIRRETILGGHVVDAIILHEAPAMPVALPGQQIADLSLIAPLLSCSRALGAAERGFEMVLDYARERRQFGRPIGAFQAIQHKLANSRMLLDAARLLVERAASSHRAGGAQWVDDAHSAILFCQLHLRQIALETHHCFGAIGFAEEHEAPSQFRIVHADIARSGGFFGMSRSYADFLFDPAQGRRADEIDESDPARPLRCKVRHWLDANWGARERQENADRPFEDRHWNAEFARKMGSAGWTTINWPSHEEGLDLSPVEQLAFSEEIIRHEAPDGSTIAASRLLAPEVIAHGSSRLKAEMIPLLRSGEASACLGYSEPGAGSDLASLQTTAMRDAGGYVVNGQKIWTSDGHRASHMLLAARTNPDQNVKHGAITLFVVPMDTSGITLRPMPALHGHVFCNIFFDDVRIPEWTRLGEEGEGWSILSSALASERVVMGAFASQLSDLLGRLIARLRGSPLAREGDIRARIAVLAAEVQAARLLSLRSIELSSGDYTPLVESAMAKVFASELSQKLTETAIDIFGPAAMVDGPAEGDVADGLVGQLLRRSIMMVVGGGSNEIQRNVIALRGLRLPSK